MQNQASIRKNADHLGNVRVMVTDLKHSDVGGGVPHDLFDMTTRTLIWNPRMAVQQALPLSGENPQRLPAMVLFEELSVAIDVILQGAYFYESGIPNGDEQIVDVPGYGCGTGGRHSGKVNFQKYQSYRDMKTIQTNASAIHLGEGVFDESAPRTSYNVDEVTRTQ